jgi:argininosuccinate lyase
MVSLIKIEKMCTINSIIIICLIFSTSFIRAQNKTNPNTDLSTIVIPTQPDGVMPSGHDGYYYMSLINRASLVNLVETKNLPSSLAGKIAKGIQEVDNQQDKPGAMRSPDYLVFEFELLKAAGPDASRLHTGRSRQDMASTSSLMFLREGLLDTYEQLNCARKSVLDLATLHKKTIIPGYTHGVQAQPTTLAHYLLSIASVLQRDAERFMTAYSYINKSPQGSEVLGTSIFDLDRERLAELLGFDGVIENAYDANHWSPEEANLALANVVAVSAIGIGHFVQDIHLQYSQPRPWILIKQGELTGISSNMPQKRNPKALEDLRELCSTVIGLAQTVYFVEHNTTSGMDDYRRPRHALNAANSAQQMYALLTRIVDNLDINVDRALEEVNLDYSTMSALASILQRDADVPFRIGHHFASELTNYGRQNHLTPIQIPYKEAVKIYKEATEGQKLPFNEAKFKEAISAEYLVFNRKGLGGSQLSEVERMLSEHLIRLAHDNTWIKNQYDKLDAASANLNKLFADLISKADKE